MKICYKNSRVKAQNVGKFLRVELFETLILFIVYQLMQFGLKLIVVSLFNQSGIEIFQSGAISIDIQYLEKMFQRELLCLRCSFFVIVFALFLDALASLDLKLSVSQSVSESSFFRFSDTIKIINNNQ